MATTEDDWEVERLQKVTVKIGLHPTYQTCVIVDNGDETVRVPVDEDNEAQRNVPTWAVAPLRDIWVRAWLWVRPSRQS